MISGNRNPRGSMVSGRTLKQVFISYRHESEEHAARVRRLGELLRGAGLEVALDQFLVEHRLGGPNEGWPKWCDDSANKSACVLVIGSAGWFAAYNGTAPGSDGCGAACEAHLFRQDIYDAAGNNPHIRLAFLHNGDNNDIPVGLRAWRMFKLFANGADFNQAELSQLVGWANQCLDRSSRDPPQDIPSNPVVSKRNPVDRALKEVSAVEPHDSNRPVPKHAPTPPRLGDAWFRVARSFAHLWALFLRHRKAVAAIAFTAIAVIFVNDSINQSPPPADIEKFSKQIDQALHVYNIAAALDALSRFPKGIERKDECDRIADFATKFGTPSDTSAVNARCSPAQ